MVKLKTFDNGLRLVYNNIKGMYSVTTGIWVGVGSSNETSENNGISHFIEHMLFKGTDKRSAFHITDDFDKIGAQYNAFTSKENTCYYSKSLIEDMETSLELLSDIFFNSTISTEELEKEKGVIIEEIAIGEDEASDVCFNILSKNAFEGHSLGQTIIGTNENINKFTQNDLLNFMKTNYTSRNTVISVCGDFDEDKLLKLIEKYFVKNFKKTDEILNIKKFDKTVNNFDYKFKPIEQSHIAMSFNGVVFGDKNSEKNMLITNIFGGGMSSRLFQSVRENLGLAYSVYSLESCYKTNGMNVIYAGINPKNVSLCIKTIKSEIDKFIKGGMTKDEFERSKKQMKAAVIMSQESNSSQMILAGKYMVNSNRIFSLDDKMKKIDDIKFDEMKDLIKNYFNFDTLCGSYVGPETKEYNVLELMR